MHVFEYSVLWEFDVGEICDFIQKHPSPRFNSENLFCFQPVAPLMMVKLHSSHFTNPTEK